MVQGSTGVDYGHVAIFSRISPVSRSFLTLEVCQEGKIVVLFTQGLGYRFANVFMISTVCDLTPPITPATYQETLSRINTRGCGLRAMAKSTAKNAPNAIVLTTNA